MTRNRHATQGSCLAEALKRKPHTYMQMLEHGLSCSPWKRLLEWAELHSDKWEIEKGTRKCGCDELVTWRVCKVRK